MAANKKPAKLNTKPRKPEDRPGSGAGNRRDITGKKGSWDMSTVDKKTQVYRKYPDVKIPKPKKKK